MIVFIGDVHGKYKRYSKIIKKRNNTIQVGDMGIGFKRYKAWGPDLDDESYYPNPPYDLMVKTNARFIRGNHDNPGVCEKHTQYIPDGTLEKIDGRKCMFIGGALSIDRAYRLQGYTYWDNEELNQNELVRLQDRYITYKPDIMITHECPEEIAQVFLMKNYMSKTQFPSITRQAFHEYYKLHKPKVWIFGHWHQSFDSDTLDTNTKEYLQTRFICLNELEVKEI